MATAQRQRLLIPRDREDSVWLGGIGVHFKVSGDLTGGGLTVVEHPLDPGRLVPPHVHHREDEVSYVLEGTMGARIGDQIVTAGPGDYLFKPRDVPHTFWNAGPDRLRIIEIAWPAGLDDFFRELAVLYEQGGGRPDPERATALAARYGASYRFDWVDELKQRYGLKLLGE